jgi:hypothetical protein
MTILNIRLDFNFEQRLQKKHINNTYCWLSFCLIIDTLIKTKLITLWIYNHRIYWEK